ncbi:hypothetical protein ABK040_005619 [Willaertia magna]
MSQEASLNRANDLVKQAEKILSSFFYLKGDRTEDALECYRKAGNMYKMAKAWREAGDTFKKMIPLVSKSGSIYEAATTYIDASNCYRQATLREEAGECIREAISLFTESGKFATAAKYEKEVAELCEKDEDYETALIHYKAAADFYEGENQKSSANQCIVKLAHICANLDKFDDAIEYFERAASAAVDDKLLKWGAKEYLFKAMICFLAKMETGDSEEDAVADVTEARNKLEEYKEMDIHFVDSLECNLLTKVIDAIEKRDVKGFTIALRDHDKVQKLDNWKTTLFLKIKDKIKEINLT